MANVQEIKDRIAKAKLAKKVQDEEIKKAKAEAKEAGIVLKAERVPDTPEMLLFKNEVKSVIESNIAFVSGLFAKTVSEEKPLGQDSIGFMISDRYTFIIRDMEIVKAKKPAKAETK